MRGGPSAKRSKAQETMLTCTKQKSGSRISWVCPPDLGLLYTLLLCPCLGECVPGDLEQVPTSPLVSISSTLPQQPCPKASALSRTSAGWGLRTSQQHQFHGYRGRDNASVSGSGEQGCGTQEQSPSSLLPCTGAVWNLPVFFPSSLSHWDSRRLEQDLGFFDDSGCLFGAVNIKTNMAI